MNATIDSPAEYALYALAKREPDLFAEAERFTGGMLAEDQDTLRRVKAMLPACRLEQEPYFAGHAFHNPEVMDEIVLYPQGKAYAPLASLRYWMKRYQTSCEAGDALAESVEQATKSGRTMRHAMRSLPAALRRYREDA